MISLKKSSGRAPSFVAYHIRLENGKILVIAGLREDCTLPKGARKVLFRMRSAGTVGQTVLQADADGIKNVILDLPVNHSYEITSVASVFGIHHTELGSGVPAYMYAGVDVIYIGIDLGSEVRIQGEE